MRERTPLAVLLLALSLPAQVPDLPPVRLEGVAVDPRQRPVPGARIEIEHDGRTIATVHGDGEGRFVVPRAPQDVVLVRAFAPAPDIGAQWIDLLGQERGFVRVTLGPARRVAGTVRDGQGQPVPGAWVVSEVPGATALALTATAAQCDANGAYHLSHVPMGAVTLRAWADGCDAGEGRCDDAADATVDLVVERDGFREQRFEFVGADAATIAAARLHVAATFRGLPACLPPPLRRVSFAADGTAVLRGWPDSHTLHVRVVAPGVDVWPVSHTTAANQGNQLRRFHRSDETTRIRGRLAAAAGTVLGNRLLALQPVPQQPWPARPTLARTRADGSFEVTAPVRRSECFALRIGDAGLTVAGDDRDRCWFVGWHGSEEHLVPVEPARKIRLRVRGPDGSPAAGIAVTVFRGTSQPRDVNQPGWTNGLAEHLHLLGEPLAHGVGDADGSVRIRGLQLFASEIVACLAIGADGWTERIAEVGDGPLVDLGVATLDRATEVAVDVREGGDPVSGARVHFHPHRTFAFTPAAAVADREGRLVVRGLLPHIHSIGRFTDGLPSYRQVHLAAGENELSLH